MLANQATMKRDNTSEIVEYIIRQSILRENNSNSISSNTSIESVNIFDELDSMPLEDLIQIVTIFFLGRNTETSIEEAEKKAQSCGFEAIDEIAFYSSLHTVLEVGMQRLKGITK